MVKHIVMFKLKEFDSAQVKNEKLQDFKLQLEALPNVINEIKYFEVGINYTDSPNAFDLVLISEFGSKDDLKSYAVHPEHLNVVEFVKEITSDRKVVDFEI